MATEKANELRGVITRIFHASPNFSAGRVRRAGEYRDVSFAGACFVREGDIVKFRGGWVNDPKFGEQFKVESLAYEAELDADGLAMWLAKHGVAAGIGPVRAKKIADEYGKDFSTMLAEDPGQIAIFANVPLEEIQKLQEHWAKHEERNTIATKLAAWEMSKYEIDNLLDKFGASIITILTENPYMLLTEVDGFGFRRIDAIALKLKFPKMHPGRLRAGMVHALAEALDGGSTCEERNRLLNAAEELLILDDPDGANAVARILDDLAAEGKDLHRVGPEPGVYALSVILKAEQSIAATFASGADANRLCPPDKLDAIIRTHCADLHDPSQEAAIRQALTGRVTVITGAAGSGKSTIIKTLVRIYKEAFQFSLEGVEEQPEYDPFSDDPKPLPRYKTGRVALCAPTGKAARQLSQVTGRDASTIHRLLNYHPVLGWQQDECNPISADIVIVDEVSMADSLLLDHLFRAIKPTSSIVLVGDHRQLPPVGPGSPLRDAIEHKLVPLAVLEKCHRQAGVLKHSCNRLMEGVVERTSAREGPYSPWIVFDRCDKPEDILALIERLFTKALPDFGFSMPFETQFQTPIHKGPIGTQAINTLLQRLYQKSLGVNVAPSSPDRKPKLYVQDKVICTKNNYVHGIMNGHQGQVLCLDPLTVRFDEQVVTVPKSDGSEESKRAKLEIDLAYCLTPHKMQGSEVPCAVTIVHRSHSFMLHRNWLYTAATRAQKCSIVIGDHDGVTRAVERVVANQRKTLLGILGRNAG